jgi:hypothetical protein
MILHYVGEILLVLNGLAIDCNHKIATDHDGNIANVSLLRTTVKASMVGSAARDYLYNQQP